MTAHATIEERQRCLAAGMNDHISKPIDPALLFETVARFYQPPSSAVAAGSAPSAAPTTGAEAWPTALESLDGLDLKDGLARVGGNRNLYVKLLRQFLKEQADAAVRTLEQLKAGDVGTAERTAHTLKGIAGNLGAKAVQAGAAELEEAIRKKLGSGPLEALQQRLSTILAALMEGLRAGLGEAPKPSSAVSAPIDPEQGKALVAQMRNQLADCDAAATASLEAHRAWFASLFSEEAFAQFEQHVQGYQFGEAQTLLEAAMKARGL